MLQKKHNSNWSQIPDHSQRILITGGSGSRKTISLFNVISHQSNIDKIFLYPKDPYKEKYQLLTNKRKITGLKHFNDSKAFMIWMISIKTLKNIIQVRKIKC